MKIKSNLTGTRLTVCLLTLLAACRPDAGPVKPINHTMNNKAAPAMNAQEQSAVAGLQWLNTANAFQDATNEINQAAAEGRQPRLIAFAGRGLQYPGITHDQLAALQGKAGYKIAEGSGDVLYGEAHRQMRQKLLAYAITYNQAIAAVIQ